jgi:hypothetical protein
LSRSSMCLMFSIQPPAKPLAGGWRIQNELSVSSRLQWAWGFQVVRGTKPIGDFVQDSHGHGLRFRTVSCPLLFRKRSGEKTNPGTTFQQTDQRGNYPVSSLTGPLTIETLFGQDGYCEALRIHDTDRHHFPAALRLHALSA